MRVIIVGGGKTVYFLTKQFISKGYEVTIINRSHREAAALSRQVRAVVVHGDGSDTNILEQAGARKADAVVALTPHDQDNLIVCQLASRMFGVPRTVAIVNDPENEEVFQRLGVTVAVSASRVIATLIEEQAGFEEILNLFPVAEGRIMVTEVIVRQDAPALEQSLQALELPEGVLVAGILRNGEVIVPRGNSLIQLADRLVLVLQPDNYSEALQALTGKEE